MGGVDDQTRDLLALVVLPEGESHMDARHVWSPESLRKGLSGVNVNRHDHEHGRQGHKIVERRNEENLVGIDATVLWREAWIGDDGDRLERGGKYIERNDCNACYDAPLLGYLLACEPSDGCRGCALLVCVQGQDHPKVQKVGDFLHEVREASKKVVSARLKNNAHWTPETTLIDV